MKSHIVPAVATDCEMILVTVKLVGRKILYHSNIADEDSLDKFSESLDRAASVLESGGYLLIGGDMNLPGWDWPSMTEAGDPPGMPPLQVHGPPS